MPVCTENTTRPSAPRPAWLKVRVPAGANYGEVRELLGDLHLHTVCQSARCPNLGHCWDRRTATFMILGNACTRNCGFCAVSTAAPLPVDPDEPARVAEAVTRLGLRYAVITSVTRDDLPEGGASQFAATIRAIRGALPDCEIEVLIPDFQGSTDALRVVLDAAPDVLNHNLETVPRLYSEVRPQAVYRRSLDLLQRAKNTTPGVATKSGLLLGLGEQLSEVRQTMRDLRAVGCELLTLGQYLRPSLQHLPVARYYEPDCFDELRTYGESLGFRHVESGPFVRSSYHADRQHGSPLT